MKLSQLSFFKGFPSDLLIEIEKCAEAFRLASGQVLIAQGVQNQSLYFLIQGELAIYVDEGLVAKLNTAGDLVGEMSLITQHKSSATIRASMDTQLIRIKGEDLHKLAAKGQGYNIYQIYSDILVQKLEATNQKAKHLESLMARLQKAQVELQEINQNLELKVLARTQEIQSKNEELKSKNDTLKTSNDKLASLYQNRDLTFNTLDRLLKSHLLPLEQSVAQQLKSQNNLDNDWLKIQNQLKNAILQLEPLSTIYESEKSMNSQRVLLADPIKKQHSVARMALGGTGVELDIVQDETELEGQLTKNVDIFIFSEEFLGNTRRVRQLYPKARFVYLTSEPIPQYVPKLLSHDFVPNVVSRDEEDRLFTIKNYVTTVSKLTSRNLFGLDKYLSWGVEVQEIEVSRSDQRREIINKADTYFEASGIRSANRDRMKAVAEELLMNAIYDAPRDSQGKPLYNHQSRTETVVLQEGHRGRFRYSTDGLFMAISIEDPFGGLDANTLFRYLEKCYSGTGSLNDGRTDKGGGGRGLHQIIENSDLVVFNIDPGLRTEVIALFNTDPKSAPVRYPNLHFFKSERDS